MKLIRRILLILFYPFVLGMRHAKGRRERKRLDKVEAIVLWQDLQTLPIFQIPTESIRENRSTAIRRMMNEQPQSSDLSRLNQGLVTINEVRREHGLDPVQWGDDWFRL